MKPILPPNWVKRLLTTFLNKEQVEASLGDLEEKFQLNIRRGGVVWKVKLYYLLEAIGFLRMVRLKKTYHDQSGANLILHTLLFFTRLVRKDKSFYLVSLLGLTISIAAFMMIVMFIRDEVAYDKFHVNGNRIYNVATYLHLSDVEYKMATTAFPAAPTLQSEYGEIEQAVRVFKGNGKMQWQEKKFQEQVVLVDPGFLSMFTFPLLKGDPTTALEEPGSIVLTATLAKKYFGDKNPLGESLTFNGALLTVTGVMDDVPLQSHLTFSAIIPLAHQLNLWKAETGLEGREHKWFWISAYTYVLLQAHANAQTINQKMPAFINKYFPERYRDGGLLVLRPLYDIHLSTGITNQFQEGGSLLYLRLFSFVALVIMIISTVNLINLSYFKITTRLREIGIRKFLGQRTAKIIAQLSIESIMTGIASFLLAFGLCVVFLPAFNSLVQKEMSLESSANQIVLAGTFLLMMFICVLAVLRPSLRYASRPARYLLLNSNGEHSRHRIRNILIGLQVGFSFVLLVLSFVISGQIDFFRNKDLGFNKENMVVVDLNEKVYDHLDAFLETLRHHKDIIDITDGTVPGGGSNSWRFVPENGSKEKPFLIPLVPVGSNYLSSLNIQVVAGRNFDHKKDPDSLMTFIINKRASQVLGWGDDPINKKLEIFAAGTTDIMATGIVVGMIDDFHFESLRTAIRPMVLTDDWFTGTLLIRVAGDAVPQAIDGIESTWKKFSDEPFLYEVLNEKIDQLYEKEAHLSALILFFTLIALYLTCYGLFAMSSMLFTSKLKEVAIRKVFGADHLSIIRHFYSRYAFFTLLAMAVGLPVAIYIGDLWLQTFEYHIALSYALFLKAAACILVAGILSVTYYLAKVALSNPVQFLRTE